MDFKTAVKTCLNKYLTIEGRAQRSEYWWFALFNFLVSVLANILDFGIGAQLFGLIATLALLAPGITAAIRRMHDINKTGWWVLIALIPLVGWIVVIYWFIQPGTSGENQFGPDPLEGQPQPI